MVLDFCVSFMFPLPDSLICSPLPSGGSRGRHILRGPAVRHLHRYIWVHKTSPSPVRAISVSLDFALPVCFPGDAEISQVPGESLCQRAPGSGLRRLVTTSHNGCSISVFRQAKNVDTATCKISELIPRGPLTCCLRFNPRRSPHERQGSLPACPLRLWPGWVLTNWIPLRGFR